MTNHTFTPAQQPYKYDMRELAKFLYEHCALDPDKAGDVAATLLEEYNIWPDDVAAQPPAAPVETEVEKALAHLTDVGGDTLETKVAKLKDWYLDLQKLCEKLKAGNQAHPRSSAGSAPVAWRYEVDCGKDERAEEFSSQKPEFAVRNLTPLYSAVPQAVQVTPAMIESAARAVGYRDYIRGMHKAPKKAEDWSRQHYTMYTGIAETALRAAFLNCRGLPDEERSCANCHCPTFHEEALVNGQFWCHPCADAASSLSRPHQS